MKRRCAGCSFLLALVGMAGCSASPPAEPEVDNPAAGAAGVSTGAQGGGAAGTSAAGSESGGTSSTTTPEASSAVESDAGPSIALEGGSGATSDAARPSNFVCSQVLGLLTSNEWYSQGFEMGVDPAKWQIKYQHYGYVREWANPDSTFWNAPISSACKESSTLPDRVVFAALDWEMLTEAEWVAALTSAVNTIKLKYPGLRWIDLTTLIRCPSNQMCNSNAKYGPGANTSAPIQDCYVPPYEDSAIAKVAAAHPDFVGVGPKVEASACRVPVDGAHLSQASNAKAATDMAAYYKTMP